jgi:DnaJ-class molecular chaperone
MPFFERNYAFGNLYVDFEVLFPEKIGEQKIKELSKV